MGVDQRKEMHRTEGGMRRKAKGGSKPAPHLARAGVATDSINGGSTKDNPEKFRRPDHRTARPNRR